MERGFPERFVKRKELNFLLREVAERNFGTAWIYMKIPAFEPG